jgi:tetratricopeptide (TPR) repeat protein
MLAMGQRLKGRVHAVNVTDGSRAVMRMSSWAAAVLLQQQGVEAVCQVACRDRNRIALQADLIGVHALGLRNILALTGDPVKAGDHPEARAVFEQALRADPENLVALRVLGDIAKRRGDPAAARRWYERVLEADPRNDDIASQLKDLALPSSEPRPFRPPTLEAGARLANAAAAGAAVRDRMPDLPPPDEDDPFAFPASIDAADGPPLLEVAAGDWVAEPPAVTPAEGMAGATDAEGAEAEFEEGLLAPMAWPDTADLVARRLTPRALPAFPMPVDDETIAAFGRERYDPPAPPRQEDVMAAFLDAAQEDQI